MSSTVGKKICRVTCVRRERLEISSADCRFSTGSWACFCLIRGPNLPLDTFRLHSWLEMQ